MPSISAFTCLSSCSLFVIDKGASNGFSSFSVSRVWCVFVTAPARGSRNTYFLYLWKTKDKFKRYRGKGLNACHRCRGRHPSLSVFTHKFSVVLKSNRELTDEMFLGRPPNPSSVSSSDFFLLLTHTGKYVSFSWRGEINTKCVYVKGSVNLEQLEWQMPLLCPCKKTHAPSISETYETRNTAFGG